MRHCDVTNQYYITMASHVAFSLVEVNYVTDLKYSVMGCLHARKSEY